MNSWKIILAALVIFGAGVVTGGLLVNHVKDKPPGDREISSPAPGNRALSDDHGGRPPEVPLPRLAERLGKDFVHRLNDSLRLTPEQRDTIAKIVADGQERNRALWTNFAPQMHKVIQDVNQQIRAQLTPEQIKQFEELMKPHPARRPPGTNAPPESAPSTNPPPAGA